MFKMGSRAHLISRLCFVLFLGLFLCQSGSVHGFTIDPQNIQAIAIYGKVSGFGKGLQPNQIAFKVADPSVIGSMISSIEFSVERDCSTLGARTNAYIYIKFSDNSVEVYDLFNMWSHISKMGLRGSCYFVSEEGQTLFQTNAQ